MDGNDRHADGGTYRVENGWDRTASPSMAVPKAVASVRGVDPIELDPLYDVIDGDALDALFESSTADDRITFPYEGFQVTVAGDGTIELTPLDEGDSADS